MEENERLKDRIKELNDGLAIAIAMINQHGDIFTEIEAENERLLDVVKMAYRKHHLDDMTIGWDELSNALHTELCNSMGDKGFCDWLHELKGGEE